MRAVLVSAGVHVALIAAFTGWHVARPQRVIDEEPAAAPSVELQSIPHIDIVPLDVALVTLPDEAPANIGGGGLAIETKAHGGARIVAAPTTGRGTGTAGTEPKPGTGGESLRMRGRRHDLSIPGDVLARILDKPVAPPVFTEKHHRLEPNGGAGSIIRDKVATIRVAPDGTVDMKSKPYFTAKILVPLSRQGWDDLRRAVGKEVDAWLADPYRDQKPIPTDEVSRACMMHDDVCAPKSADSDVPIGLVGGKADITGYLHHKLIGDPYSSRKLALLDGTRDARAQAGAKYRGEQLDRSAIHAQRNVEAAMQTPDPVARKAALFALWDECVEGEGPAGQAGERARAIVIGAIRARLPAGSPGAFTADEIARFDRTRSSRQHFAPY